MIHLGRLFLLAQLLVVFAAATLAHAAATPVGGWSPAPLPLGAKPLPGPLFAAGDGQIAWMLLPAIQPGSDSLREFSIATHLTNQRNGDSDLWLPLNGEMDAFQPLPQCVAISDPDQPLVNARGRLYVFFPEGQVSSFNVTDGQRATEASVPEGYLPIAAAGMPDGLYLLTRGPANTTTATSNAATTASTPATTTTATAETHPASDAWVLWHYHDRMWMPAATIGRLGASGEPSSAALIRLVRSYDKLVMIWCEPWAYGGTAGGGKGATIAPPALNVRMITPGASSATIGPIQSIPLPQLPRTFFAATLAPQAMVLWPVEKDHSGGPVQLEGGVFNADGEFVPGLTLPLDKNAQRINVETDLTIAPIGNVLGVFFSDNVPDHPSTVHSMAFTRAGVALPALTSTVIPMTSGRRDTPFYSSLALIIIITLLAASLWQYQYRPGGSAAMKKKQLHVARVTKRIVAMLIDFGISVIVVLVISQLINGTSDQDALDTIQRWFEQWINWQTMINSPDLLLVIALYTVSVTIGELIGGRSIGKAVMHLKVVTMDGNPPPVGAILIRNVIRIFEMTTGILLIFMLINENRQRLGDLFARTIVIDTSVAPTPPKQKPRQS
jgi:uncharacterized RDD family membrane protein YckC